MMFTTIAILVTGFTYFCLIVWLSSGWRRLKSFDPISKAKISTTVSIVIAARNEEQNIARCLNDLLAQDFSGKKFEIIVVDDHSSDNTSEEVNKIATLTNKIKFIRLAEKKEKEKAKGKKAALAVGINEAKGELIITTDADCRFHKQWLQSLTTYYETFKPVMISAPVIFEPQKSFSGKFYELEFIGLVVSGAGALRLNKPLMCNGANLAFSRRHFLEFQNNKTDSSWASGDDMFLMHWVKNNYGAKNIHFLKSGKAVVTTKAPANIHDFVMQRIRWGSKTRAYPNTFAALVAAIVFINSLFLIAGSISSIFFPALIIPVLISWILKFLSDWILLYPSSKFFNKTGLLKWFVPFQIFHAIYILSIAILSMFSGYNWKGRRL
ncbi:MAG: glycosyltransferase [Bacteroidales bacterium]